MATTTIPWNDGSGDNIYVSAPSQTGSQTVTVSSDENKGSADRTQTVTFTATANGQTVTKILTLIQAKVAEQYIVFADSAVEQICATKWGDGVGLKPSQAEQVTNSQLGTTFRNNTNITSFDELQYFTGLTQIPANAFNGCTSLQSIVIPEGVTQINGFAFRSCSNLVSVSLPSTLKTWSGNSQFRDCVALATITLPDDLTSIPDSCFQNCPSLTIPDIPSSVTTIGSYSFYDCHGQKSLLVVPSTVTSLGTYCFQLCTGLASVKFLCNAIPNAALSRCGGLTSVEVGPSCTSIGTQAFFVVGTTANKCTFIFRPTTPPTLASTNAFTANRINKIYVPNGTLSAYQTASNWSSFASYMAELDANGNIPT